MRIDLDQFDLKILSLVQNDNSLTTSQLAQKVNLSVSSVQRRLRRLREEKIIEREIAVVSPEAIGRTLMAVIEIALEHKHAPASVDTFKRFMLTSPEVMQCYHVTGTFDFLLIMALKDMEDYQRFLRKLVSDSRLHIKNVQTSIVVNRVKIGLNVPIEV